MKEDEDIFPSMFSKIKGIAIVLGEMKIQLQPNAKLVKKWPYWLNFKYKEKVWKELDSMINIGIIVPMEESK